MNVDVEDMEVELYFNNDFMAILKHGEPRRVGTFEGDLWEIRLHGQHILYWPISSKSIGAIQRFVLTQHDIDHALTANRSIGKMAWSKSRYLEQYWKGMKAT